MARFSFLRSFRHAWRGLCLAFGSERNFRIQCAAGLMVLVVAAILPLAKSERLALLIVTMVVLVLELLNSSLERLVDLAKPRFDAYAGDVKDLMAGAVLLASLFAAVVGFLIFKPYLLAWVALL